MAPRTSRKTSVFAKADLFDPVEQEILCLFFGMVPRLDRSLLMADPAEEAEEAADLEPWDRDAAFGVRLGEPQLDTNHPDPQVAVTVARICLHVIGRRPPPRRRCTAADALQQAGGDGTFPRKSRKSQHLFTVDWAMGCWPEAYFAIRVPGFDRHVVVKQSEAEGVGGPWVALGWFPAGEDVLEGSRPIVCAWWNFQADCSQSHWERFWSRGLVDEMTAKRWAASVWDEWEGHEEQQEDDQEDNDEGVHEA